MLSCFGFMNHRNERDIKLRKKSTIKLVIIINPKTTFVCLMDILAITSLWNFFLFQSHNLMIIVMGDFRIFDNNFSSFFFKTILFYGRRFYVFATGVEFFRKYTSNLGVSIKMMRLFNVYRWLRNDLTKQFWGNFQQQKPIKL